MKAIINQLVTEQESLSARLDMKIQPSLKDKLQVLANKDRRELSDFIRIKLEDLVNGKPKKATQKIK